MSKTKISEFDSNPANNTDIDGINLAEGMAPGLVNNAIRELMAQLKDFQAGSAGDNVTVGGNLSYTGTLTGSTGVLNIGSGQVYKDASGNVGIGTSSPTYALEISGKANNIRVVGTNTSTDKLASFGGRGTFEIDSVGTPGGRFIVTDDGNVGIGTTTQSGKLHVNGAIVASGVLAGSKTNSLALDYYPTDNTSRIIAYGDSSTPGELAFWRANSPFSTGGESMRITSGGKVLIGGTSTTANQNAVIFGGLVVDKPSGGDWPDAQLVVQSSAGQNCYLAMHIPGGSAPQLRNEVASGNVIDCVDQANVNYGNFRAAAFTVASDYRLKENIAPLVNALDRVALLQPKRFSFTENSMMYRDGMIVDGFLAHEVSDAVPEAVTGVKDDVLEDGTPRYQSIDQAKLVPLLTAAIQELQEKIQDLQNEVNALKQVK